MWSIPNGRLNKRYGLRHSKDEAKMSNFGIGDGVFVRDFGEYRRDGHS